jgi:hypothetical protein
MLIHDRLAFHNVAELLPVPGGGVHLARFPARVWGCASARAGALAVRNSAGCEIRFVSTAVRMRLFLRCLNGPGTLVHLRGSQIAASHTIEKDLVTAIDLDLSDLEPNRTPGARSTGGFSPLVNRLYSCGGPLVFYGIDDFGGVVRPPERGELPELRWLAYGSSITQGGPTLYHYVHAAAQMLESDVRNLGMAGSCRLEPEITDFVTSLEGWDFALFEAGVNLIEPEADNAFFAERVRALLEAAELRHPGKPVFLVTMFPNGMFQERSPSAWQQDAREKNEILRQAARKAAGCVHLIEGETLLPDFRGFHIDLLHPEPFAAVRLGLALSERIAGFLRDAGN